MKIFERFLILAFTASLLTGCGMKWKFWEDDQQEEYGVSGPVGIGPMAKKSPKRKLGHNVKRASRKELSLMNAQLWTRVDYLEREVTRQKEMLEVLKKGLILGILPDELKVEYDQIDADHHADQGEVVPMQQSSKTEKKLLVENKKLKAAPQKSGPLTAAEESEYRKKLALAQDEYRSGRYGKAITQFSAIGSKYGGRLQNGSHKYWLALSWSQLKEYETAVTYFKEFMSEYPQSHWIPRSKLELARLEFRSGYRQKALERLKNIIKKYPYEDASEMAKMEIEKMNKAL